MRRNLEKAMGSSVAGMGLGIGFLAQEQSRRVPIWVFLLVALLVIVVAVIWVLYEEQEEEEAVAEPEVPAFDAAVEAPEVPTRAEAVEELEVAEPEVEAPPAPEPDDLTRIEGIGPKLSGVLQAAGISTFAGLAETEVGRLRQVLDEAGIARISDPATWPEQAKLAAAGDWEALETLQDRLKGGREV